ncbi:hypothetical protein C8F04DRAFT_1182744 [Mycena alexandri]|uniref:Uncharacterized protein n=1 Tax=Mycena alexandri TaxID=1745969 RepID=A0AAD6SWL6_9AGAR|nr:hypothetical protein C8F04DRAFT_1182744 [Mycena alexandri]
MKRLRWPCLWAPVFFFFLKLFLQVQQSLVLIGVHSCLIGAAFGFGLKTHYQLKLVGNSKKGDIGVEAVISPRGGLQMCKYGLFWCSIRSSLVNGGKGGQGPGLARSTKFSGDGYGGGINRRVLNGVCDFVDKPQET